MQYLKKNTVKTAILMARACQSPVTEKDVDQSGRFQGNISGFVDDPNLRAYLEFLGTLTPEEFAELTALLWLGQDRHRQPEDWQVHFDQAMGNPSQDLQRVSKYKLPQYLRRGMERLARHARNMKVETAKHRPTLADNDRRMTLAGRFTIQAFEQRYGKAVGLQKLGEMLELKGFLHNEEDRIVFGLPGLSNEEDFEITLSNFQVKSTS